LTGFEGRKKASIKKSGKATAKITDNKVIIEPVPSIEQLFARRPLAKLTPKEAERLSEQMQLDEGTYG
jgi:hypothetical protein